MERFCSAASQNRDRTRHRRSARPRLCSAPLRKSYALHCVRGKSPIVSSLPSATKQFCPRRNHFAVLKQTSGNPRRILISLTTRRKGALSWRSNRLKQGTTMLYPFKLNTRRAAVALGALAVGVMAFSAAAGAAPLQLFPFILTAPVQAAPQPQLQALPQAEEDGMGVELPARLKRQVVNYATREAPGTIVID